MCIKDLDVRKNSLKLNGERKIQIDHLELYFENIIAPYNNII